jgi:hypothetical protein
VAGTGTGLYVSTVTVLNGAIQSINLGNSPYGYDTTATLSNPPAGNSGTATTGYAVLMNGEVDSIGWTAGTANYGPTVTITGGTTNATATANVTDGAVTGLVLTGGGTGYGVPTVTVSAPSTPGGVTATATATTANGQISGVTITNGGSGYTSAPTVTFSAPASGTTAVAGTPVLTTDPGSAPVSPSNGLCSKLFTLTPSISGVIPNNTLQAFINLARNPYPSATAMDPTNGLLGLVSGTGAFQPTLTSVPYDWSLAVSYGSAYTTASTGTALPTAGVLALDANDTLFSVRNTALTTSTPLIYGVGAYGVSVPAFGNYTTTAKGGGNGIATDLFGNIWATVNTAFLYKYPAAGGALTSYSTLSSAYGVAVDANNNVWVGHSALYSGNDVDEFAYTSGTWAQSTNFVDFPGGVDNLAVDANQNIWGAPYVTAGINGNNLVAAVLPNTGTVSSPNYNPSGGVMTPLSTPFLDGSYKPFGVAIDASGNAWYSIYGTGTSTFAGLQEVTPNSPSSITVLTSSNFLSSSATGSNGIQLGANTLTTVPAIDGAGTLFLGDAGTTDYGLHVYSTITGNTLSLAYGLKGCLATTAAPTVCAASTPAIYGVHGAVIDSTGSVWVDMYSGGVSQIIGLAAPTYPALAAGKPGLSPGLSAVNPLP